MYSDIGVKSQAVPQSHPENLQNTESNEIYGGLFAFGEIGGQNLKFLIDTGASISVLSRYVFEKLPESQKILIKPHENEVLNASGTHISNYGTISLEIKLNEVHTACKFPIADISDDGILGLPLTDTGCKLDFSKKEFEVNGCKIDCVER